MQAVLDAHGHDPNDFRWVPVLRKPRKDGWSPERQRAFIAALADCGCVEQAAKEVGMSVQSCYRLRRSHGAENFAAAWDAAIAQAARGLVDLAFERAINGTNEPVFDREGNQVGRRHRHHDGLLKFLLSAYLPERFRHAHQRHIGPAEASPPRAEPVSDAMRRLTPVTPEHPHRLASPDQLDCDLLTARIADGELPHFHRERWTDPVPARHSPDPEFEAALAAAKAGANPREG